jgi:hypothetical protein
VIYKHRQIGYLMGVVTLAVLAFFVWAQIQARLEPPSVDSGANLLVTAVMTLTVLVLASFSTLRVSVDEREVALKFGFGFPRKSFALAETAEAREVRNKWYYGWGIRLWFWPRMWIYNVSGLDAVELRMKNGKVYRIGTDEPAALRAAIEQATSMQRQN